jgi:hypothetical protein
VGGGVATGLAVAPSPVTRRLRRKGWTSSIPSDRSPLSEMKGRLVEEDTGRIISGNAIGIVHVRHTPVNGTTMCKTCNYEKCICE